MTTPVTPPSTTPSPAAADAPTGSAPDPAAEPQGAAAQEIVDNLTTLPDFSSIDIERVIADLLPVVMAVGVRILGVILLVTVALFLSRWFRRVVGKSMECAGLEPTVRKFTTNLTGWLVIGLALIVSLGIFGVNTTTFAAVLGAAGLAIGLGFQGALANIAAGVLLLALRPFRVGDLVEVHDELGIVEAIDLYFTRINRFDNTHTIVPNDEVLGNKIENYSRNKTRRVSVAVETAYDVDPVRAREVLDSVIAGLDAIDADAANGAVLMGFGASGIEWEVRVHCDWDRYLETKQALIQKVWSALDEAGIDIPFPHRNLVVNEPMRLHLDRGRDDDNGVDPERRRNGTAERVARAN